MRTNYVDLYVPTRDCPYWHTVTRPDAQSGGYSSSPIYDHRNGLTNGRTTLTQDDALAIVRRTYPFATIVVRGEATRATQYKNPELARSEPPQRLVRCEITLDTVRDEIVVTSPTGRHVFVKLANLPLNYSYLGGWTTHAKIATVYLTRRDMVELFAISES